MSGPQFVGALLLASLAGVFSACRGTGEVVVYTSVDEVFARPVAERFSKETGIEVRLVTDTEETKSTGLVNRLMAEKARPVADVFWSGDPARAAVLRENSISDPYDSPMRHGLPPRFSDPALHWTGFSTRARVLVYNREKLSDAAAPTSIFDLHDVRFRGQGCIANPLFGTTSMHAAALFAVLGTDRAREFFEKFRANGGRVVSSNGEVRRAVASGSCSIGITDTDDANVAIREGKPIEVVYPDQDGIGTLLVPNCALLIARAPHPAAARRFVDFLLSPEVERMLAQSDAAQIPLRDGVPGPPGFPRLDGIRTMDVDYFSLASSMTGASFVFLKDWVEGERQPPD